ncbi:MAG: hypothetical protein PVSMB4_17370 [Ktedonobacterales bacterium]
MAERQTSWLAARSPASAALGRRALAVRTALAVRRAPRQAVYQQAAMPRQAAPQAGPPRKAAPHGLLLVVRRG